MQLHHGRRRHVLSAVGVLRGISLKVGVHLWRIYILEYDKTGRSGCLDTPDGAGPVHIRQ